MTFKEIMMMSARIGVSLVVAGIVFCGWLALFLLFAKDGITAIRAVLWISAPGATAFGFAAGYSAGDHVTGLPRGNFTRRILVLLVACSVGAVSVFWFGPMLIVFGMFAAGGLCIVLWEAHRWMDRREA